ncbi:MAG TPA: NADH-quinone oxidoreductase subunit J [Anaerolineaceae bacterium]|nr:NADH-quinone oxidoreductase subunit J [Anaerolineaceae bacterium]HPN50700.1 NADH-quinone oxidoreductase subunit J [Anaerolineaceae bacterium]
MLLVYILIVAATAVCAFQAIRANRMLVSAIWLAGTSALVALMIYLIGAPEVAVVELSVGAGLVTVLFVFAINIAGEETYTTPSRLPRPLAWGMVVLSVVLLGWFFLSRTAMPEAIAAPNLSLYEAIWQQRNLDILLQVALIFCGVLGAIGLLSEDKPIEEHPAEVKS